MSYGRGFRRHELGTPRLAWEQGGTVLNFEGERIWISDLQQAAVAIVDEAETLLNGLLAGTWAQIRPTIVLGDIIDSLVYEGPGRSFATNSKNRWLQAGVGKMAELVGPRLFRAVKTEGGRTTYKCRRQAVEEFILHLKRFKSTMLAAVHIWGGKGRRVVRWLPEDVSRIMVVYVAWLVPFEQVLHRLSGAVGHGGFEPAV
ncbi:hypothetical protein QBC34DRAFT_458469 [Podospora aff. communis PSN243]|uniref:Uncharacterized protein n=1 Tax=Podospora aff. communis PSN243 TaxID=3040156 RepID=A0AAV9G1A1_9PEZI|nr:hypothetical protein QBC34DRAFT_458469 [Podospora aff. communis PSN243]